MGYWVCHDCGHIHVTESQPERCEECNGSAVIINKDGKEFHKITKDWAGKHPLGPVAKKVPKTQAVLEDLLKEVEIGANEAVKYYALSRIAAKEGYYEIAAYLKDLSAETVRHAALELELTGQGISENTEENVRKVYEEKIADGARKTGLSKRATATGSLHGEHELMHEIARDVGDWGITLGNLVKRYFG